MKERNSGSPCVCLRVFLLWGLIVTIVFCAFCLCSVRAEAAAQSDQPFNETGTQPPPDDIQADDGAMGPPPGGMQQGNGAMGPPPGGMQQGNGAMGPPPGGMQQGNGAMGMPPGPPPNFSSSRNVGPSEVTAQEAGILALTVIVLCGGLAFSQCYHRGRKRF